MRLYPSESHCSPGVHLMRSYDLNDDFRDMTQRVMGSGSSTMATNVGGGVGVGMYWNLSSQSPSFSIIHGGIIRSEGNGVGAPPSPNPGAIGGGVCETHHRRGRRVI